MRCTITGNCYNYNATQIYCLKEYKMPLEFVFSQFDFLTSKHPRKWRLLFVTVPHKTRLHLQEGLLASTIHLQPLLERLPNVLNANDLEPVILAQVVLTLIPLRGRRKLKTKLTTTSPTCWGQCLRCLSRRLKARKSRRSSEIAVVPQPSPN